MAHLPTGRVVHDAIGAAGPVGGEARIGRAFNYAVATAYGFALRGVMGPAWLATPAFLPAWVGLILMIDFDCGCRTPASGRTKAESAERKIDARVGER